MPFRDIIVLCWNLTSCSTPRRIIMAVNEPRRRTTIIDIMIEKYPHHHIGRHLIFIRTLRMWILTFSAKHISTQGVIIKWRFFKGTNKIKIRKICLYEEWMIVYWKHLIVDISKMKIYGTYLKYHIYSELQFTENIFILLLIDAILRDIRQLSRRNNFWIKILSSYINAHFIYDTFWKPVIS